MKFTSLFLGLILSFSASALTKNAASKDPASSYELTNTNLFRIYENGRKCQVTSGVSEIKVQSKSKDAVHLYFVKNGDLKGIVDSSADSSPSNCPSQKDKVADVLDNVDSFKLVTTKDTALSLLALGTDDVLVGKSSGNKGASWVQSNVKDYSIGCYGQSRSFSSYVAFALLHNGDVVKIKGSDNSKKTDSGNWTSVSSWKSERNVCK